MLLIIKSTYNPVWIKMNKNVFLWLNYKKEHLIDERELGFDKDEKKDDIIFNY